MVAPTLWSSIALLNTMVHETKAEVQDFLKVANAIRFESVNEIAQAVDSRVASLAADTIAELVQTKDFLVASLQEIGGRFHHESSITEELRVKVAKLERDRNIGGSQSNRSITQVQSHAESQIDYGS
jgi:hypothetical protein